MTALNNKMDIDAEIPPVIKLATLSSTNGIFCVNIFCKCCSPTKKKAASIILKIMAADMDNIIFVILMYYFHKNNNH